VSYELVYHADAFRRLLALRPAARRERILRELDRLAASPSSQGDFVVTDSVGRPNQVALVAGVLVRWWPDDAVKELRIVSIEPVFRSR
jgi:hypothetical protein